MDTGGVGPNAAFVPMIAPLFVNVRTAVFFTAVPVHGPVEARVTAPKVGAPVVWPGKTAAVTTGAAPKLIVSVAELQLRWAPSLTVRLRVSPDCHDVFWVPRAICSPDAFCAVAIPAPTEGDGEVALTPKVGTVVLTMALVAVPSEAALY